MSTQLVLMGPSGAGKTSLMLGSAGIWRGHNFTVDRTWTTQTPRSGEGTAEKIFTNRDDFTRRRACFLMTFSTFADYEYGIDAQSQLERNEVRMRILPPAVALRFRHIVQDRVTLCSITPYTLDVESLILARDPAISVDDLAQRVERIERDQEDAAKIANICFQNTPGLEEATARFRNTVTDYF